MRKEALDAEEERQRAEVAALPPEQRKAYHAEAVRRIRDPDTYAALNWSLLLGAHHVYVGDWLRFSLDLAAVIVGVLLLTAGQVVIGIVLLVLVGAWEMFDLFRSETIVREHNLRITDGLLKSLR